MDEPMIKIHLAAKELDLSYKTLYNWIEDGTLKLAHPGFVHLSEVNRAIVKKQNIKSEQSKSTLMQKFTRDEKGRFRLISGGFNGKHSFED